MNKKNKIIFTLIIIITIVVVGICIYYVINNRDSINEDGKKFRTEYMELNDTFNEVTNKNYYNVFLSETNTVKYKSPKEIIEVLKNGTGIIYFGYNTCSECRILVPILTDLFEKNKEELLYVDVKDIRSSFEVQDGKINKIKNGTKEYYEILKLLKNELDDLYLEDDAGNKYGTNEKNFFVPIIIAVNNGKITGKHIGNITNGINEMTKDEEEKIKNELESIIKNNKIENDSCKLNRQC